MNDGPSKRGGARQPRIELSAERFREGDPETVAEVARLVGGIVRYRGYYVTPDDRPELIQDVIVDLWAYLRGMDRAQLADFAALVKTVAHRRCVDWMRRQVSTVSVREESCANASTPERAALAEERSQLAARLLESLGPVCREIIRLHSIENRTFREIADAQGRLEKTVRNQMYKCLQRARDLCHAWKKRERLGLDPFGRGA